MAVSVTEITSEHVRRFRDEGYFVVEGAVPADDLETLRGECQRFVDERDREMTHLGVDTLDLCHRGRRYFVHAFGRSAAVERFLFSDLMARTARAVLGNTVYLCNEQFVVKVAERGMAFGWHQDSGYIPYPHAPYLTCWIPLDDATEANGTIHLLPYSRAGTREVVEHRRDEKSNDLVGYLGHDPGEPVVAPAGSLVCFSSTLFHRAGPNTTDQSRRAYVVQYSAEPLLTEDRSRPRHLAEPLPVAGQRTTRPETKPEPNVVPRRTDTP
jgi:ectoine hydroxylase-related dioxygenase (phytanoyl-CoA dioxygenase family)